MFGLITSVQHHPCFRTTSSAWLRSLMGAKGLLLGRRGLSLSSRVSKFQGRGLRGPGLTASRRSFGPRVPWPGPGPGGPGIRELGRGLGGWRPPAGLPCGSDGEQCSPSARGWSSHRRPCALGLPPRPACRGLAGAGTPPVPSIGGSDEGRRAAGAGFSPRDCRGPSVCGVPPVNSSEKDPARQSLPSPAGRWTLSARKR